jgi:hypothetical protein
MTTRRCDTPKIGRKRISKGGHKLIESRVIGVEVVCGPIKGVFIYYTDNLVTGGANIMVEIQRQGELVRLFSNLKLK